MSTGRDCSDLDRSVLAVSRSLEFLASQVVMALGDLVLSRHDSLLDSALSKMRAVPPTHLFNTPANASSGDFDWCWVCWVFDRWLWCHSPCSEAVFGPVSFWSVWQGEGGAQGFGSLFLILWRLRPLR